MSKVILLMGLQGTGKSTKIRKIVERDYSNSYKVLITNDSQYQSNYTDVVLRNDNPLNNEILHNIINKQKLNHELNSQKRLVLIFDPYYINIKKDPMIEDLIVNGKQYNITTIISTLFVMYRIPKHVNRQIDVYYIVGGTFESDARRIYDVVKHKFRNFDRLKLLLNKIVNYKPLKIV